MMSRVGVIINYSQSLLVAVVAFFILKESFTKLNLASSIGAYLGVAIIALGRKEISQIEGEDLGDKSTQFKIFLATTKLNIFIISKNLL